MSIHTETDLSPVLIHTIRFTPPSEVVIPTQEGSTTGKVTALAKCIICFEDNISNQTPPFPHKTNQNCTTHQTRQICHICMPRLDSCPVCREDLTTGEMQADILVEMPQNNSQELAVVEEENEEENPPLFHAVYVMEANLNREEPSLRKICKLACVFFCVGICYGGATLGGLYLIRLATN